MSIDDAYAILGNPTAYVSRRTRSGVSTVTIRLKTRGRTLCKVVAEQVPPNAAWRINVGRYAVGSPKRIAAHAIALDCIADEAP